MFYGAFYQEEYRANPAYLAGETLPALFSTDKEVRLNQNAGEILRIVPYVGMEYPKIQCTTKAVLHESFHSGTIAVNDALRRFMSEANERNIPVYLTGLSTGEAEYETVENYRRLGVMPLQESAAISQYCKLWLLLSNEMELKEYMNLSVAEDYIIN
jgi:L-asparaginase